MVRDDVSSVTGALPIMFGTKYNTLSTYVCKHRVPDSGRKKINLQV